MDSSPKIKQPEYKIQDGLNYRSQIDLLVTFSLDRLPREKFLSLLLYLSQASITNGEYLTAVDINEKIISLTVNDKDMVDLSANAHLLIGEIYSRQASWQLSFDFINKALELFLSANDVKGVAKCENLLGTIYGDLGDVQKAIENFESALEKSEDKKNYSDKGKIEINLGIVNSIKPWFISNAPWLIMKKLVIKKEWQKFIKTLEWFIQKKRFFRRPLMSLMKVYL